MSFKKPDVKGPRFRKFPKNVLDKNLFKRFKEKHPEYSELKINTFREVIKRDNAKIPKIVLENRDGITLRERLGTIFIASCDPLKNRAVDYGASIKAGDRVLHKNWDTDNRTAKIIYTNCKYNFQNRHLWKFKAVREFVRDTSKVFKKDYNKYIQISTKTRTSALIK